jgi:hypothetical protein
MFIAYLIYIGSFVLLFNIAMVLKENYSHISLNIMFSMLIIYPTLGILLLLINTYGF